MQSASAARLVITLSIAVLSGAASAKPPPGYLPDAEAAALDPHGAWVELWVTSVATHCPAPPSTTDSVTTPTTKIEGELIACAGDSIHVLTHRCLVSIARDDVSQARATFFDAGTRQITYWTIAGAVSTLTHGLGLVFSLPLWIIGGLSAHHTQANAARMEYEQDADQVGNEMVPDTWVALATVARFPAGLPPAVDRHGLVGKVCDTASPAQEPARP